MEKPLDKNPGELNFHLVVLDKQMLCEAGGIGIPIYSVMLSKGNSGCDQTL